MDKNIMSPINEGEAFKFYLINHNTSQDEIAWLESLLTQKH